jgi:hypothetical protein
VEVEEVVTANLGAELADRFEEGQALDVADRAADLDDHHVDVGVLGHGPDPELDLVGDVRDDLDGLAEVVAPTLLLDHRQPDLPRGHRGAAEEVLVDEPLVVAEVEVGLAAVLGDEHLAVLEGVHRAGIDVEVGIELLEGHLEAAGLEQPSERCGGDALAEC